MVTSTSSDLSMSAHYRFSSAGVRSVMAPEVLGIAPEAPLDVALRLMVEAGVRHLPVITGDRRCVGLLHESDALWDLWAREGEIRTAAECCRRPAPGVDIDSGLAEAAAVLAESGSDAAVVSDRGHLVGIVTATDIVRLVAGHRPDDS